LHLIVLAIFGEACLSAVEIPPGESVPDETPAIMNLMASWKELRIRLQAAPLLPRERIAALGTWRKNNSRLLSQHESRVVRTAAAASTSRVLSLRRYDFEHAPNLSAEECALGLLDQDLAEAITEICGFHVTAPRRIAIFEGFAKANQHAFAERRILLQAVLEHKREIAFATPALERPPQTEEESALEREHAALRNAMQARRATLSQMPPRQKIAAMLTDGALLPDSISYLRSSQTRQQATP